MTLELINPDGLPTPESYTHIASATGRRVIFVAGQLSEDAEGNLVGRGNFAAQARVPR
jgi:enamine deaminase RidA (YjgF/YER057c/UK114 family)